MRLLNGLELAGYIKERQAHEVRTLRQANKIFPKLVIVRTHDDPVSGSYLRRKQQYGADILVDVEVQVVSQAELAARIIALNNDDAVHGIILQLPLEDVSQTADMLNLVMPEKDVDGLSEKAIFDPATPIAINWLLAGYNIELTGKQIVVVGQGRLVGAPLTKMWQASGYDVTPIDKTVIDLAAATREADVLVTATGVPGLIKKDMVKPDVVIVDAGVATSKAGLSGDVDPEVRELPNITITPLKGGVGPLTVCALFENVIRAARLAAESQS